MASKYLKTLYYVPIVPNIHIIFIFWYNFYFGYIHFIFFGYNFYFWVEICSKKFGNFRTKRSFAKSVPGCPGPRCAPASSSGISRRPRGSARACAPSGDYVTKFGATFYCTVQGCQIFLGPNIPNWEKYDKCRQTIPNGRKLYQMAIKYSKWS
jgi:hypothetical protein